MAQVYHENAKTNKNIRLEIQQNRDKIIRFFTIKLLINKN